MLAGTRQTGWGGVGKSQEPEEENRKGVSGDRIEERKGEVGSCRVLGNVGSSLAVLLDWLARDAAVGNEEGEQIEVP